MKVLKLYHLLICIPFTVFYCYHKPEQYERVVCEVGVGVGGVQCRGQGRDTPLPVPVAGKQALFNSALARTKLSS